LKPEAFVKRVSEGFETNRNAAQATPMRSYLRGQFPFLGIPTPERKALLNMPEREYQHAAIELLDRSPSKLSGVSLRLLRELIQTKAWWDTVDTLSTHCVAQLVLRYPAVRHHPPDFVQGKDRCRAAVRILRGECERSRVFHSQGHRLGVATIRLHGRARGG